MMSAANRCATGFHGHAETRQTSAAYRIEHTYAFLRSHITHLTDVRLPVYLRVRQGRWIDELQRPVLIYESSAAACMVIDPCGDVAIRRWSRVCRVSARGYDAADRLPRERHFKVNSDRV